MTQKELDAAMLRLNSERTVKMNDINRKRDEARLEMEKRVGAVQMQTAAKRNEIYTHIEMLRKEMLKLDKDSKAHEEKTEETRRQENRIRRLKDQEAVETIKIRDNARAYLLQMDYEARRVSQWFIDEKARLAREYVECRM